MKGVIFFHSSIEEEIKSLQRRGQKFKKRNKNKDLDMFLFRIWIERMKRTVSPNGHLGIKKKKKKVLLSQPSRNVQKWSSEITIWQIYPHVGTFDQEFEISSLMNV